MLEYASSALTGGGYSPYYMYRQSKCVGNLENVGWCKSGKECLYNVFMMEECHTVLAVGAGAVTKLCEPGTTNVERIFNYKYPWGISVFVDLIIYILKIGNKKTINFFIIIFINRIRGQYL